MGRREDALSVTWPMRSEEVAHGDGSDDVGDAGKAAGYAGEDLMT